MRLPSALVLLALTAPLAAAQDPSADPNFGSAQLEEGFMPDPYSADLLAGGSVLPAVSGCSFGHVSEVPDLDLYYSTTGASDLYVYAVSGSDTTILVNLPDGSWACDDDSYGDGDPLVVIPAAEAGLYNIWVGTYDGEMADATLHLSEGDPR